MAAILGAPAIPLAAIFAGGFLGALDRPLLTLERIRVCKRDGHKLADPERLPVGEAGGRAR